ncbi:MULTISPECIES: drug/metabolite exporter YedA [Oleiagrimonas]|uniref:Drug/metabolite exporter YedA n=1 Tax=Oleiagrimonas citrea TaxID=1665687 RepID=A0A846ZM85_9GAMM|nr:MULTISPECIES: drug/metabolite exporter YedA [Oleiagrimonas]NKZ39425.1 drug/metabolite exporter YedA [Oleiagrimonas citrea]RAP59596.1 drug/metabolite exporter YedA [Oleiagrimonas sp. MCCC 1A03011]
MTPTADSPAAPAEQRWLVPLALVSLYVVWGSTYLGIRFALVSWPPFMLAAIRFALAGVLLYAWLRLRGAAPPTRRQWRNAAITGTLLLLGGNGLVCYAEQSVSSGIAAVAVASMPLFATLFNGFYGEWPQRNEILGLVIGFIGVVVLNLGSTLSGSRLGALALVSAAALWAFGSSWSRRQDMPAGPMNTAAQMLCASIALTLTAFLTGERLPAHPELHATLAIGYLVVFGSLIGFSSYVYLLKTVRPALSTSYAYVNPPVAVLFGLMLGGEHVGPVDLAGMAVILVGVAIVIFSRGRAARAAKAGG